MARDPINFDAIKDLFQSQRYFDSSVQRFPQIKELSHGAEGFSFLVHEVDASGQPLRKLAVKYAKLPEWDEKLRIESEWLQVLRHALHVVNPVTNVETHGFGRPVLVMEFLDHGPLKDFLNRVKAAQIRIPNLILWRLLLCLTRLVIGLAYPPPAPVQRETIPAGNPTPLTLIHDDLHGANILMGTVDPSDGEHDITPIIKAIDFGMAHEEDHDPRLGPHTGIATNLYHIGVVMQRIFRSFTGDPFDPLSFQQDRELDPELAGLVASCLSAEPLNRPLLARMLGRCEDVVANRTADEYLGYGDQGVPEQPDALAHFVKTLMLNAADTRQDEAAADAARRTGPDPAQPPPV